MAHVRIEFCPVWGGYDERAASLAAELSGTAHTAEIAPGRKSQFDVIVDGELAFSKEAEGRFPDLSDVLDRLS